MPFKKGHKGFPRGSRKRDSEGLTSTASAQNTPAKRQRVDDGGGEQDDDGDGSGVGDERMVLDGVGDGQEEDGGDGDVTRVMGEGEGDGEEDEDVGTPVAQEEDDEDDESVPEIQQIPTRRRGRGRGGARGGGRKPKDWGSPVDGEDGSEHGTPRRRGRGRGRGSRGGFRGRRRGVAPEGPKMQAVEGIEYPVVNDEVQIDFDEEGETKVDELGRLKGDREYRVRTFTIISHPDRLYMLSTEPARCTGFRDSYLFFAKHPKLFKVLLGDAEKKDLIDRDILPNSYKGRNIGVVSAKSVFREFGSRIIVAGKKVTDDYKVTEARANGEVEGELADPDDSTQGPGEGGYNRNRYVAWFGASDVYRNTGAGAGAAAGKPGQMGGRRRNNITLENWQTVHAREACRFNSTLAALRQTTHDGVYDTHTNRLFYPSIMQPTHAKWEQIPPSNTEEQRALPNGNRTDTATAPPAFAPIPAAISRNFAILDTHFTAPPISNPGYPGPDGAHTDPTAGTPGLSTISPEVVEELPEECRKAFAEAKALEEGWKKGWAAEAKSALRGDLRVGLVGYPL
ncbi:hypothetical protein MBLNU230_g2000t1 [Neophaeotheca triangularis]